MNYTPKQLEIMRFIRAYRREHDTSPTLEEIGHSLGVHRVTVHQHVAALVKKGALRKLAQRSRSIEILDREYLPKPTMKVLGRIAAGRPIEAVENPEPYTIEDLLPIAPGDNVYLLRVVGDSMIEDHITDGDLVLVERANTARDGEIVVAVVDGEPHDGAADRPPAPADRRPRHGARRPAALLSPPSAAGPGSASRSRLAPTGPARPRAWPGGDPRAAPTGGEARPRRRPRAGALPARSAPSPASRDAAPRPRAGGRPPGPCRRRPPRR
jgi:repressor LexA